MSQTEILQYLSNIRLSGNDSFFTMSEIQKQFTNGEGKKLAFGSVWVKITSLDDSGFLDVRLTRIVGAKLRRAYRLNTRYITRPEKGESTERPLKNSGAKGKTKGLER